MSSYCPFCGNPFEEGVTFCPNCGAHIEEEGQRSAQTSSAQPQIVTDIPVTGYPQQQSYHTQPTQTYQPVQTIYHAPLPPVGNPDADSALWLSLAGLFCFPIIPSFIALIYGIKALQKPNKHATAIIAIILAIGGLWPLLFFLFWW